VSSKRLVLFLAKVEAKKVEQYRMKMLEIIYDGSYSLKSYQKQNKIKG
jgi:hypothetical protein